MTTHCPRCFTPDRLRVVGAYVYSAQGAEDRENFRVDQFDLESALVSQKLYQCQSCNAHIPETEMQKGKERVERAMYWQSNVHGRRIPVVCPSCKNARHFVCKTLLLTEQDVPVEVMTENHLKELGEMAERVERQTIPIVFRCAKEGCLGEIMVNDDDFAITPIL